MTASKVIVGMSGGVDSAVAAALLVEQGYQVEGVTLQVWEPEDETATVSKRWQERGCCKVGLARYVAKRLGIRHDVLDIRQTFRTAVIEDFVAGYLTGSTPNPCVRCNERVKLQSLFLLAEERGADFVATGHYARVMRLDDCPTLHRGLDTRKDQSYFLYRIRSGWLRKLLFPVGAMQKADVWKRAEALGLPEDELKESQEICFVSQGDYRTFIQTEAPHARRPGHFVSADGTLLGQHEGIALYTPGQRRGLRVASGRRLYVQRVESETNTVVLGPEESLYRSTCTVTDLNLFDDLLYPWFNGALKTAEVKVRYATPPARALLTRRSDGAIDVQFQTPQRALSPGQSAVFYDSDRVLGGGIIQRPA
jgi:tRNA-uridine 2-sulfurtransferase